MKKLNKMFYVSKMVALPAITMIIAAFINIHT